jgi:hypothetical protein
VLGLTAVAALVWLHGPRPRRLGEASPPVPPGRAV